MPLLPQVHGHGQHHHCRQNLTVGPRTLLAKTTTKLPTTPRGHPTTSTASVQTAGTNTLATPVQPSWICANHLIRPCYCPVVPCHPLPPALSLRHSLPYMPHSASLPPSIVSFKTPSPRFSQPQYSTQPCILGQNCDTARPQGSTKSMDVHQYPHLLISW